MNKLVITLVRWSITDTNTIKHQQSCKILFSNIMICFKKTPAQTGPKKNQTNMAYQVYCLSWGHILFLGTLTCPYVQRMVQLSEVLPHTQQY